MVLASIIPHFDFVPSFGPVDLWDLNILKAIQQIVNPVFDVLMPAVSFLADDGWFWIVLTLILMIIPKTRKIGFTMACALLLGVIFGNGVLKHVIGRSRPYELYKDWYDKLLIDGKWQHFGGPLRLLVADPGDTSFPSGHTLASIEAALALFLRNKKWGIPALVLAFTIAFSRLYVCVHYPTDVLAGLILGAGFAFLAKWIVDKIYAAITAARAKKKAATVEITVEETVEVCAEEAPLTGEDAETAEK